jgi:hypothetical protein
MVTNTTLPDVLPDQRGHAVSIARAKERGRRDTVLFWFFVVQTIGVTVLQKFGYGSTPQVVVPLILPIIYVGLAIICSQVKPILDIGRIILYLLLVISSIFSTAFFADRYSISSIALLFVLYLPLVLSFPTSDQNYRKCLNFFSNVMIIFSIITLLQHIIQVLFSWQYWPNLDDLVPHNFLIPNYNYMQEVFYGSKYLKPNGIFFLEVSFLSQYVALALAAELVLFHRTWRILLFAAVIFSSFAGTGLLLLLLSLPVLLGRTNIRTMTIIVVALMAVALAAYYFGWLETVSHRLKEYQRNGSSADMRFVEPLNRLFDFVKEPSAMFRGIGAGQIEKANNFQWWPITKAAIEYGLITGIVFYGFFLYTLFHKAPYRQLAFVLAVWFSLEGSLLTAVNPLTCALFSSFFVLDRGKRTRRPRPRSNEDKLDGLMLQPDR